MGDLPAHADGARRWSRRGLLGRGLVAAAMGTLGAGIRPSSATEVTPPGAWRTWLLDAGDELRPPNPGDPTGDERAELLALQGERTAATASVVATWADGPAVLPWTDLALDLIRVHRPGPVRAARALALLHAALHDAVVATSDARAAFPRPAPWQGNRQLAVLGRIDPADLSSFPSEHAAVAGAAAIVLTHLFSKEPSEGLAALAESAAESRLWAGTNYRSDIETGLAIGRAVGERAVARAKADGADAVWDGSGRPTGEGAWQPTPPEYIQRPLDPLAGAWRTWVLPRGDAYRPPAPPAAGSPAGRAELAGVREAVARRTPEQEAAVVRWAGGPGTATPAGLWVELARDLVVRGGIDSPHAARVLGLTSVAMADAFVCCWDAKYAYWTARPITAEPDLPVLIPTPPFPSYTSGHAAASAAAATVLAHLFPSHAAELVAQAAEAAQSRLWAGIHFPLDCELGAVGGGMVGRLVVLRAQADGAA